MLVLKKFWSLEYFVFQICLYFEKHVTYADVLLLSVVIVVCAVYFEVVHTVDTRVLH